MNFKKSIIFFSAIVLLFSIYYFSVQNNMLLPFQHNTKLDKIKSANLSTDYNLEQAMDDIKKLSLNTVNIPVVVNIDSLNSSKMSIDDASLQKCILLLKKLQGSDIKIILEAYPWIKNGSEYETKWQPSDVKTFFSNWKTSVLKVLIDKVAIPYNVEVINTASNFVLMEDYQDEWCDVIKFVRSTYSGQITFRTSWWYTADWDKKTIQDYNNKLNNKIFSQVDFISVSAYFELTENETNSVKTLTRALQSTTIFNRQQNVKQELNNLHTKWDKPIFFGELGFPRTNKAAMQPWNPFASPTLNNKEQANCFEAYRSMFENEPWILGFSVFSVGDKSSDKLYYPSPESIKIIRKWYSLTEVEE